jgi:hypothetical protein
MSGPEIDWRSAEVSDGDLTVQLSADVRKKWRDRLVAVLGRLDRRGTDVKVGKRKVTVSGVTLGKESEVRHLLEAAVLQVNTDLPTDDEDDGDDRTDDDQKMTETFRSFAS